MSIKQELLNTLNEESIPYERAVFLAVAMVEGLRCDRCRNWTKYEWADHGYCEAGFMANGRIHDAQAQPDDFCSHWQAKGQREGNERAR